MSPTHIILNIYGGTVHDVLCTDPTVKVRIGNWRTDVERALQAAEALHDPA